MTQNGVTITADKLKKRKKMYKNMKIILLVLILVLIILFAILSIIYHGGMFTITLDPNFALENSIIMYEDAEEKDSKKRLYAEELDFMDNISVNWLPKNIDDEKDGAHNGENYIAYTFYLENLGEETQHYWMEVYIDDVIKRVDEAVRIMIIQNGERTIYAKINSVTQEPEKDTEPFYSDAIPVVRQRQNFAPGQIDKYTVVIWLEGSDDDCIDNIIGGELKMHMQITNEHIEPEDKK